MLVVSFLSDEDRFPEGCMFLTQIVSQRVRWGQAGVFPTFPHQEKQGHVVLVKVPPLLQLKAIKCTPLAAAATCLQQLPSFPRLNLIYGKTIQL